MTGSDARYKVGLTTYVSVFDVTDPSVDREMALIKNQFLLCTSCTITYMFSDNYDASTDPEMLYFNDRRDS